LAAAANLLLRTLARGLVALLNGGAGVVLLANGHLVAVDSILTVKHVGAIHVDLGGIDVLDHVRSQLLVVVRHRQAVG